MKLEVQGKRQTGRPRKSWEEVIRKDLKDWVLRMEIVRDRTEWRRRL